MPTAYKLSALSRILLLLTFCRLSTTQILYVGDFCDFAGYDGTCLEASKCTDLQPIMEEMGFKSYQVGRCGFEVREEIICCPKRPTPVQMPPILPNEFIDLSKHPAFGYTPPPGSVFNSDSIDITTNVPIILNQNINGNPESVQSEDEILKVLFNGNPGVVGTGRNVGETHGNNNGIFNANPLPDVNDNTRLNDNSVHNENELLKNIFGENSQIGNGNSKTEWNEQLVPIISGNNNGRNVIDNTRLNGNPVHDENELLRNIFGENPQNGNGNSKAEWNEQLVPIISGNNNGPNVNPVSNINNKKMSIGNPVYDENERLRDIFGDNPLQLENDSSKNAEKRNRNPVANVNDNRKLNGNPGFEKFNAIFSGNPGQLGNENINGIFNATPELNVMNNNKLNDNPASDENELLKAIFGNNPVKVGAASNQEERKPALPFVPVANGNINELFNTNSLVSDNGNLNGNAVLDENERLKDIFGDNPQQLQNGKGKNESKGNAIPVVNGSNNGGFNTHPLVHDNQKFNGNPATDENEKFNAIFSAKSGQPENEIINGIFNASPEFNINNNANLNVNPLSDENERLKHIFDENPVQVGKSNSQEGRKENPVTFANDNSNGFFNANAVTNANDNRNLNGNPIFDENERFNAIFGVNSGHIGKGSRREERREALTFGPVISENNNGMFHTNPMVNDNRNINTNPALDDNERFNAIFNGNPGQAGSVNNIGEWKASSVPFENENDNGFIKANPVATENENQKPNDNANYDENERIKDIFGGNPPQLDNGHNSGSNSEISNINSLPKENILSGKQITFEGKNMFDNAAMASKVIQDETAIINAILNGKLNRNGQIGRNPIRNEHVGFNPNFNSNPIAIEFEIQTNNDNRLPSSYDSPVAFGNGNMNGLFNDKPLRAEHPNEGMRNLFVESGNSLNNGYRQHVRFEEALHHRREQAHRRLDRNKTRLQSRRNQRIRFYK